MNGRGRHILGYISASWVAAISLSLFACQTPRTAPRFNAPSTAPIAESTKKARQHVTSARVKTKEIEATIAKEPASETTSTLKLQVYDLEMDLDNAIGALDTSEGARLQLDAQLKTQAKQANDLADNYDKAQVQITSIAASRHEWVVKFWYSTGLLALAVAWIFRKPLLMLAGGI